jgi:hypothetical protein
MDWCIELSVKPEDQSLISYVIPNSSSGQASQQRRSICIKTRHLNKRITSLPTHISMKVLVTVQHRNVNKLHYLELKRDNCFFNR